MRICIQITLQDWDLNILCGITWQAYRFVRSREGQKEKESAERWSLVLAFCLSVSFSDRTFMLLFLAHFFCHLLFLSISQRCVVIDLFIIIDDDDFVVAFFRCYFCGQKWWYKLSRCLFLCVCVSVYLCLKTMELAWDRANSFFIVDFLVCVIVPHKEPVSSTFSRFIGHRHRNVENSCVCLCVRMGERERKEMCERTANCVNDWINRERKKLNCAL